MDAIKYGNLLEYVKHQVYQLKDALKSYARLAQINSHESIQILVHIHELSKSE